MNRYTYIIYDTVHGTYITILTKLYVVLFELHVVLLIEAVRISTSAQDGMTNKHYSKFRFIVICTDTFL